LPIQFADQAWLERFRAGDRRALEECYRDYYGQAVRATSMLRGADQETVIHEVFYRLLHSAELRRSFEGGSFGAWLHTLARNQAIDFLRRAKRDVPLEEGQVAGEERGGARPDLEADLDARRLVERFKREVLPPAWAPVFEKRFLQQLDQREAAAQLGISRTTLAYRELRIRALLKRFLLRAEEL
jgi:RNA polymerase sigma-70 factor (ECF subfamily)